MAGGISRLNFVMIGPTVQNLQQFSEFKMAAVRHLGNSASGPVVITIFEIHGYGCEFKI